MNSIHLPVLSAATPDHVQIVLALILGLAALGVIFLAVMAAGHPTARSLFAEFVQHDYWVRRAKRKHVLYRLLNCT